MTTPARQHWIKMNAAAAPTTHANANGYELMLAKLDEDRRRLREVQSTERKIEVKRELLPEYDAWIAGVLEGNHGQQDDVFMTVMLWRVDVGDFTSALELARYAIEHKLSMPDRFARSVGCLLAEEFADTALRADPATQASYANALASCLELTQSEDMPDEVRAKLHKAVAYSRLAGLSDDADILSREFALTHLQRALQLHDKVGVKKDIEQLERELKKINATSADKPTG